MLYGYNKLVRNCSKKDFTKRNMKSIVRYPFSAYQKICEMKYKCHASDGDILMFHQVNNQRTLWRDPECCISHNSFAYFIDALTKANIRYGNLSELLSDLEKKENHKIYITFDDAFEDVYTTAMPILSEYNIPFTIFVTIDLLDQPGYITTSMLLEMAKHPLCTIGSHAVSHQMLRWMKKDESMSEIVKSRNKLMETIGKDVSLFAYPFGSVFACSKKNRKQAEEAGYKMAFSTMSSGISSASMKELFFVPRRNINEKNYLAFLGGVGHDKD